MLHINVCAISTALLSAYTVTAAAASKMHPSRPCSTRVWQGDATPHPLMTPASVLVPIPMPSIVSDARRCPARPSTASSTVWNALSASTGKGSGVVPGGTPPAAVAAVSQLTTASTPEMRCANSRPEPSPRTKSDATVVAEMPAVD